MAKARRSKPAGRTGANAPGQAPLLESPQFRQLIDTAPDAMVIVNGKGEIVIVNSQTEKVFGYTADELIGKPVEVLIPERFRRTHAAHHVAGYVAQESPHARAIEASRGLFGRRKDGSEFPAQISLTPLETDEGMLISSFIRDLSPLRESEARFRSLFEEVPLGLFVTTPAGAILEANPELLRILGYPDREAFLKVHVPDIYAQPADRERYLSQTLRDGVVRGFSTRLKRRDGTVFPAELSARAVRDAAGNLVRVEGTLADTTERHLAEATIRESETRFGQLAQNISEAFFINDARTGQCLYVSPAYEAVFGQNIAEAYKKPFAWANTVHPEDRAKIQATSRATIDGQSGLVDVFRVVHGNGDLRWLRARVFPVRDDAGSVHRIVGVAEDITELRKTEAQLIQAQKMEAVGLLAGGIAHDFNNLLGAITVFGELAAADLPEGDRRREDLDSIQEAVARATTLTRQLLTFSRQQVLRPKVLDPNEVITDVLKILGRLIGEDIELLTQLDKNAGQVRADESQLEQVLMNLAVNARDAMPNGGRITVTTTHVHLDEMTARVKGLEHGGDYVVLTVTDTGTGMPADVQAHAFEPFFTTKGAKGTGLGLATVYGIVRQSGGHVGVSSEQGRGTTFEIHLPAVSGATDGHMAAPSEEIATGGSETILVAEDDPAVRLAVSSVLSRLGYTVIVARTAEDALAKAAAHKGLIHLAISDVVMPGMDGPDLISGLRTVRPDVKALLTSGYAGDAIGQHKVIESGVPFLEKPFTAARLAQRVREVLDGALPSK